jgi:hypothetical protein
MAFWSRFGGLFYILGGMTIGFFVVWWMVKARFYIAESFRAIDAERKGLQKIVVVGNDNKLRPYNVDYRNDYFMEKGADKDKIRVLENHSYYLDEFGKKVTYYHQDGTEPIGFYRQEKFFYKDLKTGEFLKDKYGNYLNKVGVLNYLKNKYELAQFDFLKDEECEKILKLYCEKKFLDEINGNKITFPLKIGDGPQGTDASQTADIINRHLELENISFWKKYLPMAMAVVIVITILLLLSAGLGYSNHKDIGVLQTSFTTLQQTLINMSNTGGFR